jgi:hypothetical protein
VSTRIEAPSLSLSPRNFCSFYSLETRHTTMENSTLYFCTVLMVFVIKT